MCTKYKKSKHLLLSISLILALFFWAQPVVHASETKPTTRINIEEFFSAILEDIQSSNISIENILNWLNQNIDEIFEFIHGAMNFIKSYIPTPIITTHINANT